MDFVTLLVVTAIVLAGLVVLGVLLAGITAPARRLNQAVSGFRSSLDTGLAPLRGGLRRREP